MGMLSVVSLGQSDQHLGVSAGQKKQIYGAVNEALQALEKPEAWQFWGNGETFRSQFFAFKEELPRDRDDAISQKTTATFANVLNHIKPDLTKGLNFGQIDFQGAPNGLSVTFRAGDEDFVKFLHIISGRVQQQVQQHLAD